MSTTALDRPTTRGITREEWLAAAVIGGLRMASNSGRSSDRSRGARKNMLNDLQGAVGELIALAHLTDLFPGAVLDAKLLVWGAGSSPELSFDPDLVLHDGRTELRLEAKATFPDRKKRRFLVNDRAYERSRARGAKGFIPIVTAPGADQARVGRLVEISELESWEVEDLGYGDPSRGVMLVDVAEDIWGEPWASVSSVSPSGVADAEWLWQIMAGAEASFDSLRSEGASFEEPLANVLAGAPDLARRCFRAGSSSGA